MKLVKVIRHSNSNLEGILHFLFSFYGSEKYLKIIDATASSTQTGCQSKFSIPFSPSNTIDFNESSYWHPGIWQVGQYVQVEIKGGWMKLDGYSIQTSYFGAGGSHPKNWAFSASKDGVIWTKNESHVDTDDYMNQAYQSKYVDFHTNGVFRFFRIIITGPSYEKYSPNRMDVNQIELFGEYYEGFFTDYYSSRKRFNITFLLLILLLLS